MVVSSRGVGWVAFMEDVLGRGPISDVSRMALDMAAVLPLRRASTIRNLRTEDSSDVVLSVLSVLSVFSTFSVFSGLSTLSADPDRALLGTVFDRDKEGLAAAPGSRDGSRLRDILEL